ncbi:polysaccharide pyruvyl transferase family protein [Azospirillum sp.]|uniref:polysaccharide pyruvyl transferase family protein n=1 Tax=Azospirillum sp. TaxID=34012 RepID=UPI002D3F3358|nr:polysaccharide pyruvyl transferase family protein [Azospirillum sp.]HYD69477.1 polysaccharide pyruvyl transferase family protein [Azospirillum sp.]
MDLTNSYMLASGIILSGNGFLSERGYSVLTPYLVPLGAPKRVNVGDGFILDSAIQLIGFPPRHQFSSRVTVGGQHIERINETRCLVVAGANSLKDDLTFAPGFDRTTLEKIRVPVIALGLGLHEDHTLTRGLTSESARFVSAMLERFPLFSVRCAMSADYLRAGLADRAEAVVMTGCPVAFPVDDVDRGFQRKAVYGLVVVTVTDRDVGRLQEQVNIMHAARRLLPARRYVLALHQSPCDETLIAEAARLGIDVFDSADYSSYLSLYAAADAHFGNRVHAHLKCLSMGIPSFLVPYDRRHEGFAHTFDFPLIDADAESQIAHYDFARFEGRMHTYRPMMSDYIARIRTIIGKDGRA